MVARSHATARCNYSAPSIHPLPRWLPAVSAAAIAANFYHVSHLNRQNARPGIQAQRAPASPPLSPHQQGGLIARRDRQPLGRMTHKETQTNIYLLHQPPLLLGGGPPPGPGPHPSLWGHNLPVSARRSASPPEPPPPKFLHAEANTQTLA